MSRKNILLELSHDIPSLIRFQKIALKFMKQSSTISQQAIDFEEDILKVLQAVEKMNIINLDAN